MKDSGLKIWVNAKLTPATKAVLRAALARYVGHQLIFADETPPDAASGAVIDNPVATLAAMPAEADIAFGQPDPLDLVKNDRLRWAHLNSAAYTRVDREDVRKALRERGCALTTSSYVYAEPAAQHLLAMMTGLARQLPAALDNQRGARGWEFHRLRAASSLLNRQSVLLLGYGHIARRFVELIEPLRMDVTAIRRHPRGDERIPVFPEEALERLLPTADHVVNTLPSSLATTNFLNAERLDLIKLGAILYNIGRGVTLDQEALLEKLQSGHLAAAYLDVTDPEPLPPESPLWTAPNLYITPHTAGGHEDEMDRLADHFLENFRRFTRGEPLLNRVI